MVRRGKNRFNMRGMKGTYLNLLYVEYLVKDYTGKFTLLHSIVKINSMWSQSCFAFYTHLWREVEEDKVVTQNELSFFLFLFISDFILVNEKREPTFFSLPCMDSYVRGDNVLFYVYVCFLHVTRFVFLM